MTAGEDQLQALVGHGVVLLEGFRLRPGGLCVERGQPLAQGALAAEAVDREVAGRGDDPPERRCGHAVGRPARGGAAERLLHRVLGQVRISEAAHERRHRASPVLAERGGGRLGGAYRSTNGRTSMHPWRAVGICPAASMASSIDSHSTTK